MRIQKSKFAKMAGGGIAEILVGVGITVVTQLIASKILEVFTSETATPMEEVLVEIETEEYEEVEDEAAV